MRSPTRSLIFLLALLAGVGAELTAQPVELRLFPEENATVVRTVEAGAALLEEALPLSPGDPAAERWLTFRTPVTATGYVSTAEVGKNFAVETGAALRAAPESGAAILARAEPNDTFEILDGDEDWLGLRFTKPLPVYFLAPEPPPSAAAGEGARRPLSYTPVTNRPAPIERLENPPIDEVRFDPRLGVGEIRPEELPPENVRWSGTRAERPSRTGFLQPREPANSSGEGGADQTAPAPAADEARPLDIMVAEVAGPQIKPPRQPQPPEGAAMRTMSGTLVRKISRSGPRYPLRLLNRQGGRIAYVDMTDLFISDLRPYLDRTVTLWGEVYPMVPGSEELIIRARTIRAER